MSTTHFYITYEWWNFCQRGVCYGQVTAMNACVFADWNSVMQQMAAVAGDVTRGWSSKQPCWTARRRRQQSAQEIHSTMSASYSWLEYSSTSCMAVLYFLAFSSRRTSRLSSTHPVSVLAASVTASQHYNLRPSRHTLQLPEHHNRLLDSSFFVRMLYKHCY